MTGLILSTVIPKMEKALAMAQTGCQSGYIQCQLVIYSVSKIAGGSSKMATMIQNPSGPAPSPVNHSMFWYKFIKMLCTDVIWTEKNMTHDSDSPTVQVPI